MLASVPFSLDKQNHCTARNIRVGPRFANCCSDTICDTFEME